MRILSRLSQPGYVRNFRNAFRPFETYIYVDISSVNVDAIYSLLERHMPNSVSGDIVGDQAKFGIWEL